MNPGDFAILPHSFESQVQVDAVILEETIHLKAGFDPKETPRLRNR